MRKTIFLPAILAGCAAVQATGPASPRNGVLADSQGMSLYIFKKDSANVSTCYDGCAKAWPPFLVTDASKAGGDFTVTTRKDGAKQWAFKGQPLYRYAGDTTAGEQGGEGSGGVWFVVRDKPSARTAPSTSSYTY